MTKEQIQDRINQINNELIQTKANIAKLEGHLGEAQYWLLQAIEKEEAQPLEAPNTEPVVEEVLEPQLGE